MDDLGLCRVGTRPEGGDRAFFLRYVGRKVKVNADKSKVMVLGGKKGLKCEVCVNGAQLDQVSVFRYFGCF